MCMQELLPVSYKAATKIAAPVSIATIKHAPKTISHQISKPMTKFETQLQTIQSLGAILNKLRDYIDPDFYNKYNNLYNTMKQIVQDVRYANNVVEYKPSSQVQPIKNAIISQPVQSGTIPKQNIQLQQTRVKLNLGDMPEFPTVSTKKKIIIAPTKITQAVRNLAL